MDRQNRKDFEAFIQQWKLSDRQRQQVERYVQLIEKWGERVRLVSKNDQAKIVSKHLQESLLFYRPELLNFAEPVLDLGSGAGFPGIPLKIYVPNLKLSLVESRKMKALFLQEVVDELSLQKVEVINDRVENLVVARKNHFGLAVARAVAELRTLWQWSEPLLNGRGVLATLKGGSLENEISAFRSSFPDAEVELMSAGLSSRGAEKKILVLVKRRGDSFARFGIQ